MTVSVTRSSDGTRIAWAQTGTGPPLIRAGMFMTHVEFEETNAVWGHWMRDLSSHFTYIRYDERGCGLSDRAPKTIGEQESDRLPRTPPRPRPRIAGLGSWRLVAGGRGLVRTQ